MSAVPNQGTTWITATLLADLADQGAVEGFEFTGLQLAQWPGMAALTKQQHVDATSRLCALGFVKHRQARVDDGSHAFELQTRIYTVTANGAIAIQAAGGGEVRKSGPKGTRGAKPADPAAFSTRLWNLMRMRRMLTPSEGAETLCDAGDDDFETRRETARKCLRRWANAGALAEGARRVGGQGTSNGEKRYVLIKDSVQPPRWRAPGKDQRTGGSKAVPA